VVLATGITTGVILLINNQNQPQPEQPPQQEQTEPKQEQKSPEEQKLEKLIGCLPLDESEKAQVMDLIRQEKPEETNALLNEFTKQKFPDKIESSVPKEADFNHLSKESKENRDTLFQYYEIMPDLTLSLVKPQKGGVYPQSKELWAKVTKVVPESLIKKVDYFVPMISFSGTAGAVTNKGDKTYIYLTNLILINDHIIFHEFGHVISFYKDQRDASRENPNYGKIQEYGFYENAYIPAFYNKFWGDDFYQDYELSCEANQLMLFILRHESEFGTKYAGTHFDDDFAECFARFMVGDEDKTFSTQTETQQAKVKFFEDYPELVALKQEAQDMKNQANHAQS
jgi:hypothetical protein